MRYNSRAIIFYSPDIEFPCRSNVDLSRWGFWTFLQPASPDNMISCSIWHDSQPILGLENKRTVHIVQMVDNELGEWLDPRSMKPIAISSYLQLPENHVLLHKSKTSVLDTIREILRIIFDYADLVGQEHAIYCGEDQPSHLRYVCGSEDLKYPEPNLGTLLCDGPHTRARLHAISSILRCPGLYDGGVEFMVERKLGPAIKVLFAPWCSKRPCFASSGDTARNDSMPLIVLSEGDKLTEEVQEEMAKEVHPILLRVLRLHDQEDSLPAHCFVYSLHISPTFISIFAHFQCSSAPQQFAQVLLSKFYLPYDVVQEQDDLFLDRWRLFVALSTIMTHIQRLEQDLRVVLRSEQVQSPETDMAGSYRPVPCSKAPLCYSDSISSYWNVDAFPCPAYWITHDTITVNTRLVISDDMSVHLPHQVSALFFHRLRKRISPLTEEEITERHLSGRFGGPDFQHPLHIPRSIFERTSSVVDNVHEGKMTLPYYFKASDFLGMVACDWSDISVFIANTLAGFSSYSVQWNPEVHYPIPIPDRKYKRCVIDFALAARAIPPTTDLTIERARLLPLTISSPAMLLGVHSTHMDDDGQSVLAKETLELCQLMEPHLELFRFVRHCEGVVVPPWAPPVDFASALFCTYVKKGFVHILEFSSADTLSARVSHRHLASLPVSLLPETDQHFYDRMRIVFALFTLQRQVIKLCDSWNPIAWPLELQTEEHAAIVKVSGVSTPSPSVDVSPPGSTEWAFEFGFPDCSLEDDPDDIRHRTAKSVNIVKKWLTELEPADGIVIDAY
ncbi:hypothetical protein NM688_g2590 [Phlebia brevispora]|uniref:Uncharacterized protein n=1 Tax=Phlebia brevispora TaxID=194682 RepID=A0ACC1T8J6_9APHY|nr:hypothetical protein NM688_g2590 [Phlebia brevispora]